MWAVEDSVFFHFFVSNASRTSSGSLQSTDSQFRDAVLERLGLASVSVSAPSRTENRMFRSRFGLGPQRLMLRAYINDGNQSRGGRCPLPLSFITFSLGVVSALPLL